MRSITAIWSADGTFTKILRSDAFELKRLRMRGELRFAGDLAVGGIDRRQGSAAKADEQPLGGGIVADVVGVVAKADRARDSEIARIEELCALALSVRDDHSLDVGRHRNALRFVKPRQALEVPVGLEIEHLHRVVAERRDEQALRIGIEPEMVDAPLHARQRNRGDQAERRLTGRALHRDNRTCCRRDDESHRDSRCHFSATGGVRYVTGQRECRRSESALARVWDLW